MPKLPPLLKGFFVGEGERGPTTSEEDELEAVIAGVEMGLRAFLGDPTTIGGEGLPFGGDPTSSLPGSGRWYV